MMFLCPCGICESSLQLKRPPIDLYWRVWSLIEQPIIDALCSLIAVGVCIDQGWKEEGSAILNAQVGGFWKIPCSWNLFPESLYFIKTFNKHKSNAQGGKKPINQESNSFSASCWVKRTNKSTTSSLRCIYFNYSHHLLPWKAGNRELPCVCVSLHVFVSNIS